MQNKDKIIKIPVNNKDFAEFNRAQRISGFGSRAELIRFLVRQYIAAMKERK
jgi:metal-responsive CopG/Arc/MetJ family transcriptional regulator